MRAIRPLLSLVACCSAALLPGKDLDLHLNQLDSVTLRLDNDIVGGTDAHYTAGTEIAFAFHPWQSKRSETEAFNTAISVGQLVFTPEDVRSSELVPDDRPYAGWAYLNFSINRHRRDILDTIGLSLGMVGPHSFAEDLQRAIHQAVRDHVPAGWRHQLHDEFGIALAWKRAHRRWKADFGDELAVDLVDRTELSLGNIDTSLSKGFLIRFGRNLPATLAPDRIGATAPLLLQGVESGGLWNQPPASSFYWLLGARATYVAQNIFLDGNNTGQSHRVDKHELVGEAEFGFAYRRERFRATLLYVYRTAEFQLQNDGQGFASLSFTFSR